MSGKSLIIAFSFASSLAIAMAATPAWAQAEPSPPPGSPRDEGVAPNDDEIIVRARRRDESQQDVPLVVNAITDDTIEKLNLRDFREIANVVPGLQLAANPNGIGTQSSIRGVNHDVNVSGENGTIQYYRNDAPVPSNFIFQTMYDIGQIEVLRGPQGTLRGRSTPSGSITINTRTPDLNEAGGYFSGTLATDDIKDFNAAINVPIVENVLGVRVAGLYRFGRGNLVTSVNSAVEPEETTEAIRATIRFEPMDFIRLGFLYEGMETSNIRFGQVQSFSLLNPAAVPSAGATFGAIDPEDRRSVQAFGGPSEQAFQFFNWNAEAEFVGQRLSYVGSRTKQKFFSGGVGDTAAFFPTRRQGLMTNTQSKFTSHEVRLQNVDRVADMFDYVIGYFRYAGTSTTNLSNVGLLQLRAANSFPPFGIVQGQPLSAAPTLNTTPIFLSPGDTVEESLFGNLTVHLGEATELSGGVRRIHFEDFREGLFQSCTEAQFNAGTCTASPGTRTDTDETTTIYNASLRHRFNDDLMVYAATGSSWRPPVIAIGNFTNAAYTPREQAHITLPSETSKSYEIGFKSEWLDDTLIFNLTGYHQRFENYPFRAAGGGIPFVNINSAGAPALGSFNFISAVPVKVWGAEAEIAYNPSERFSFGATVNYSRSRIGDALLACVDARNNATGAIGSDGIPDTVVPQLSDLLAAYGAERLAECPGGGQSASFQPEWTASLRAGYSHPFGDRVEGFVRSLVSYRGKTENDPNNRFDDIEDYALVNLYGGVRDPDGGWELSVYAKNLFDTFQIVTRDDAPLITSVTDVFISFPSQAVGGIGSTNLLSPYSSVSVIAPREIGVNLRIAFGSR